MSDKSIVKVTGIEEFNKFIRDLMKFSRNPVKFYQQAGVIMLQDIMRHFQAEENPDGSKWAPLKYTRTHTGKTKKGRRPRVKILQDTGRLRMSIKNIATFKSAETGTNLVYARTHQEGDKERNIPARTFVWLSGQAEERIMGRLMDNMAEL